MPLYLRTRAKSEHHVCLEPGVNSMISLIVWPKFLQFAPEDLDQVIYKMLQDNVAIFSLIVNGFYSSLYQIDVESSTDYTLGVITFSY